jgi:uroporphyrinogen decarboxylase
MEQAQKLAVPEPGDGRTGIYLATISALRSQFPDLLVMAGCIGPFSLAARLVGVSEAMELTMTEPELMHDLLEKSTSFLSSYAAAFKAAGADGLIMAEPAAGLLSPRGLESFSSVYISRVHEAVWGPSFEIILHNCAAKLLHLPAILKTGLAAFHFGAPMDIASALANVPSGTILCGNLDPTAVFCQLAPEEIKARANELLQRAAGKKNFVLSSGCDLPPSAPLASLDAFYSTVK